MAWRDDSLIICYCPRCGGTRFFWDQYIFLGKYFDDKTYVQMIKENGNGDFAINLYRSVEILVNSLIKHLGATLTSSVFVTWFEELIWYYAIHRCVYCILIPPSIYTILWDRYSILIVASIYENW